MVLKCRISLDIKESVARILLQDLNIDISEKKALVIGSVIEMILDFLFVRVFGWLTGLRPELELSTKGVKVSRYDKNKHDQV